MLAFLSTSKSLFAGLISLPYLWVIDNVSLKKKIIPYILVVFSQYVTRLLGDAEDPEDTTEPDIKSLTAIFFIINFLRATQDVAVDGWALSMLKPKNVGFFSTC